MTKYNTINFSKKMRILWGKSGLSKPAFAKSLGVEPRAVENWIDGLTLPNLKKFAELCNKVKVNPGYFLSEK